MKFSVDKNLNYGREQILSLIKDSKIERVIDLGAGSGIDLNNIKTLFPKSDSYGVEWLPENCEILKKNNHHSIQIDIEKDSLPFENESVDLIIANQVLEHCKEIFWISHEVTRVLKPGGSFIIGVPNLASFHNRLLLALGKQPTSIQLWSAHVRGFTKSGMIDFFEKSLPGGYALEGFMGANFYPFPPVIAKRLAKLFPKSSVGLVFKFVKKAPYDKQLIEYPRKAALETNFYLG